MRRIIFGCVIGGIILSHSLSFAEKTGWDHLKILGNAAITATGVGNIVKGAQVLVRVFKPEALLNWMEITGDVWKGERRITDVQKKMEDPTGYGWLLWSATTAAEVGATILETAVPEVRIGAAALNVGYAYYRNWQEEWMDEMKKEKKEPYTEEELPPELFENPTKPGNDHPDDYQGVLDSPTPTTPTDDLQRLLQEYDDLSLSYLAFEIGLSIDDPTCDYQMAKFIQKLKTTNPDYDKHLEEIKKLSEEAYQAAYEVQKKVCLLYYGTITETTEFPHFKTQEEATNFLNSLTPQQKQEILNLQKIRRKGSNLENRIQNPKFVK